MTEGMEAPVSAPESTPDTSSDLEPSADGGESEPEEPPAPKKFKIKVYDREEELEESEIIKRAQRATAADERFQKASEIEKRYGAMVENLKKNPWELFKALEMDPHEAAEQLLIEKLKFESMSPEQRRMLELQQRAERAEMTLKEREELEEKERERLAEEQFHGIKLNTVQQLDQQIVEAIQEAGLKHKSPGLVKRVAQKMLAYHSANDGKLLDARTAVKMALADRQPELQEYLEGMTPEQFSELPTTFVNALRKYLVDGVQIPLSQKSQQSRDTTDARPGKRVKTSTDNFFDQMDKRFG